MGNTSYEFELYPWGTEFNPVGGVYIACLEASAGRWTAIYVGKAKSFVDRLNSGAHDHDGLKCAKARRATHIYARVVSSEADRAALEAELIHRLDPICNKVKPELGTLLSGFSR
jgi:excinuclease UvrABC nuclease subunit